MIARLAALASLALALATGACGTRLHEIAVETRLAPKLDASAFARVLVAGFLGGGAEDVDVNIETVRLLRSQLRHHSKLTVIDADVLPLAEVAAAQAAESAGRRDRPQDAAEPPTPNTIRTARDLEPYEAVFANADFWKRLAEEYENPLIVTGWVLFAPQSRSRVQVVEQEGFDSLGRRRVEQVRQFRNQKGFILSARFVFIDGRAGAVLHSEQYREEMFYGDQQNTPALASYFEMMDRLLPEFLRLLTTQTVRTTRLLLR